MNIEDIKAGETYNVRVKVSRMNAAGLYCYACDKDGAYFGKFPNLFTQAEVEAFSPITPENGVKNSEHAPKYDPCRKFRKGDKVRLIRRYGRTPHEHAYDMDVEEDGVERTVLWDEKEALVSVTWGVDDDICVPFFYLELVTPVEEIEPYGIADHIHGWIVYKDTPGNVVANFNKTHPNAKQAAEAECARLNAEHRKEQNNG